MHTREDDEPSDDDIVKDSSPSPVRRTTRLVTKAARVTSLKSTDEDSSNDESVVPSDIDGSSITISRPVIQKPKPGKASARIKQPAKQGAGREVKKATKAIKLPIKGDYTNTPPCKLCGKRRVVCTSLKKDMACTLCRVVKCKCSIRG